ncbi:hypothetical protein ASPTUDRAFT_185528 [Aspergillus tubingensis CBS 134.48]|uniref:Uncharacterized protein n=1 Tax=Aspergillus tubingensis (strain CBS 134.48) TaxID=767770 RepID=A0A1L9NE51_ASPTC|nr:hypothetical protein ASPTUDRAFT_185528 [Aspergillus tubingensis CBS 134.48]
MVDRQSGYPQLMFRFLFPSFHLQQPFSIILLSFRLGLSAALILLLSDCVLWSL